VSAATHAAGGARDHDHHDVPYLGTLYLFQQTLDHDIAVLTTSTPNRADSGSSNFLDKFGSIKSE